MFPGGGSDTGLPWKSGLTFCTDDGSRLGTGLQLGCRAKEEGEGRGGEEQQGQRQGGRGATEWLRMTR